MYSADNAHFAVSLLNLACFSDKYRPDGLYAGIIVYGQKSGEPLRLGGRNIYPGYIVTTSESFLRATGTVHGSAFKAAFEEAYRTDILCEGFAVRNGKFSWKSGTFN